MSEPDPAQRVTVECHDCGVVIPAADMSMVAWELDRHFTETCTATGRAA